MTSTHGIKVVKAGKSVSSTDIRDFILHSDYSMFKIDSVNSGSITIPAGSQTGDLIISHSLGYTPAFLVYKDGQLLPQDTESYSDGTSVHIHQDLGSPYGQVITTYLADQIIVTQVGGLPSYDLLAGKITGSGVVSAYWFENIYINQGQTVNSADFQLKNVFTTATDDIKFNMWGIDEDDTDDLSGGYPSGRPKTTAVRNKTQAASPSYFNYGDEINTLIQEIVNRGGWSSGNHMGFMIEDNGTNDNKVMAGDRTYSNNNVELKITLTGTASLTSNYKVVIFKDKII